MRTFYAYIRVSTTRQGEHGVSLDEQKAAIGRYGHKNNLQIERWFTEQETAAKRGRPIFNEMLKLLRVGKAAGVIIHKIDRSARNLKDWADLGELIDAGIEVHFANESLDLHSRGGRLSADIQAVVAADYIRNLREETIKGFYGRIKQGLYPRPAPLGYLDQGGGRPKIPDPVSGPLVRQAFEAYSTGRYNLRRLVGELHTAGLRTKAGRRISVSVLSRILNNPFYTGLIKISKTGETHDGRHDPLVSVALFRRVQDLLHGKVNRSLHKHCLLFRQLWRCGQCGRCLIGEIQKRVVYYRCHTNRCPSRTVREEMLNSCILRTLRQLEFSREERDYARANISRMKSDWYNQQKAGITNLQLKLSQMEQRMNRLTDAYVDQLIDKEMFEQRKTALLMERRSAEDQLRDLTASTSTLPDQIAEVVELAGRAYLAYKYANADEKRELLKTISSNRQLIGKTLKIMLHTPFDLIASRFCVPSGRPSRHTGRNVQDVWDELFKQLSQILRSPATQLEPRH